MDRNCRKDLQEQSAEQIMKQITIKVPENRYTFFMELIKSLGFVQVEDEEDTKEEVIANLRQGFKEMELIKQGKSKGTPFKDFLDGL